MSNTGYTLAEPEAGGIFASEISRVKKLNNAKKGEDSNIMHDRERGLRQQAYRLIHIQLLIACLLAGFTFLFWGADSSASVLVGSLVAIAANFYFARKLFSIQGHGVAKKFIKAFYRGEVRKILLTIVLTVLAIKVLHRAFLPYIIGYSVTYLVFWFSPLIIQPRKMINV